MFLVPGSAPVLRSRPFLSEIGLVLDFRGKKGMFLDYPAEGWRELEQSDNGHFVMELIPRGPVLDPGEDIYAAGQVPAQADDDVKPDGASSAAEDGPDSDSPSSSSSGSHEQVPSDSEGEYAWFVSMRWNPLWTRSCFFREDASRVFHRAYGNT